MPQPLLTVVVAATVLAAVLAAVLGTPEHCALPGSACRPDGPWPQTTCKSSSVLGSRGVSVVLVFPWLLCCLSRDAREPRRTGRRHHTSLLMIADWATVASSAVQCPPSSPQIRAVVAKHGGGKGTVHGLNRCTALLVLPCAMGVCVCVSCAQASCSRTKPRVWRRWVPRPATPTAAQPPAAALGTQRHPAARCRHRRHRPSRAAR